MMEENIFEEGRRAIETEKLDDSGNESGRPEIDVRKMIIYSELLKPKFDDGLN